jgi:hypothetical protein
MYGRSQGPAGEQGGGDGGGSMSRRRCGSRVACMIYRVRRPEVWQVGTRRRIRLGLVLESRLPTGETRLG